MEIIEIFLSFFQYNKIILYYVKLYYITYH